MPRPGRLAWFAIALTLGAPLAAEKLPVPSRVEQEREAKALHDFFKAEYAWKKPADRLLFAARLVKEARGERDPTRRFVLQREARDLAASAGDLSLTLEIVDTMAGEFAVGREVLKSEAFEILRKELKSPGDAASLAREYLALCEEAIDADAYDLALEATRRAASLAKKAGSRALRDRADAGGRDVRVIRSEYERLAPAIAALAGKPDDPEANLALGRFACVLKGDWQTGLAHLARVAGSAWKAVADLEEEAAAGGDVAPDDLARGWAKLARAAKEPYRDGLVRRTLHWVALGLPPSDGATRRTLEDLVAEFLRLDGSGPAKGGLLMLTFDRKTVLRKGKKTYFRDLSGAGHHAIFGGEGEPKVVRGQANEALSFDGARTWLGFDGALRTRLVKNVNAISFSLWVLPDKVHKFCAIFDVGHYAGSSVNVTWASGRLGFGLPHGQAGTKVRAPHPDDGKWHHLACTWDGKIQKIYLDGQLIETTESGVSALDGKIGRIPARIGTQAKGKYRASRYYGGLLDEFAMFARALSAWEVTQLYLHGAVGRGLPAP